MKLLVFQNLSSSCHWYSVFATSASAQTIGAGPGILELEAPNNQVDTPTDGTTDQSRLNIDDTFTLTLAAGEYSATSWSYRAGQVGSVDPVSCIRNGC